MANNAQNDKITLPSIMIIPGLNQYQNLDDLDKLPFNLKVGMATVNDAFKNYGFDTKDFEAAYDKVRADLQINPCDQCELTELLFNSSAADVIVELDLEYIETEHGNKVTVIVKANHFSTATSLASEVCESNYFRTTDVSALTKSAINQINNEDEKGNELSYIDHFMLEIIDYLERCMVDGARAEMQFIIGEGSNLTMDSKISQAGDQRLKYVIEDWIEANSKNGRYSISNQTINQLMVDEFRYECDSKPSRVERKLVRFFDGLDMKIEIKRNRASIYIKIL